MGTYYRIHWTDCPPLTPEHAYSIPWGATRNDDGSRYMCFVCDGTGEGTRDCRCDGGMIETTDRYGCTDYVDCPRCEGSGILNGCENCDGEGWFDSLRGYSCESDPQSLIDYFECGARSGLANGETVVVFEGEQHDTGIDGEPTVVPTRIMETLTWAEFTARHMEAA